MTSYWRLGDNGVTISVKVQPKSRRPGIKGQGVSVNGPCLRLGVTEAAEDGRANRAVCELLARAVGVPAATVSIVLGQTSRDKTLRIDGNVAHLAARLEQL